MREERTVPMDTVFEDGRVPIELKFEPAAIYIIGDGEVLDALGHSGLLRCLGSNRNAYGPG